MLADIVFRGHIPIPSACSSTLMVETLLELYGIPP